jgi:hypothetical protein
MMPWSVERRVEISSGPDIVQYRFVILLKDRTRYT